MGDVELKKGMLVTHPAKPEWGPGKVCSIDGQNIHVYFRDVSDRLAKKFKNGTVQFVKAASQSDPILDNLPPLKEKDGFFGLSHDRLTVRQAIELFLKSFPGGFADPRYLGDEKVGERNYKLEAHGKFVRLLGNGQLDDLLAQGQVEEAGNRAHSLIGGMNLVSLYEAMAFKKAMEDHGSAARFFREMTKVLASEKIDRDVMEPYFRSVMDLPAEEGKARVATWPIATIFLFLAQPDRHMFLKPGITRESAERLGFEMNYDPHPNWRTYDSLLRMCAIYKEQLKELAPKDWIDVQSFFWVVREER